VSCYTVLYCIVFDITVLCCYYGCSLQENSSHQQQPCVSIAVAQKAHSQNVSEKE